MKKLPNRKSLILIHTILACFYLPAGLMYAITGGFYGIGYKGSYNTTEQTLTLDAPLQPDLPGLLQIVNRELTSQNIPQPTGDAGIKKAGTSFYLEWTGSQRDIELHPTANPLEAKLKLKETTAYRTLIQLHKAKGGPMFKWFAVTWMTGLLLVLLTGTVMALSVKAFRTPALISGPMGIVTIVLIGWLS